MWLLVRDFCGWVLWCGALMLVILAAIGLNVLFMSPFDVLSNNVVNATNSLMGTKAVWNGFTAQVQYHDAAGEDKLMDKRLLVDNWKIVFRDSDFPGLKAAIQQNNKPTIVVTVRGTDTTFVGTVANALSDGLCTEVRMRLVV